MSRRQMAWWCGLAVALAGPACRPRPAVEPPAPAVPEEEVVEPATPAPAPAEPTLNAEAAELTVKKSGQVSVLCYHDFTTGKSNNPMVINIQHFRAHMQALRDAKLGVISMDQYLAWRRGEKDIPDPAVLLTFDDGWKSVHTLALPVLKEFGYPFTIFLYRNYVNGGGRALTTTEIKDLMANGASVGSHSVSHPYPPEFRRRAKGPAPEYEAWLENEFRDSKQFLESLLGVEVKTFAYPGGFYSPEMARKGREVWGYEALFTCNAVRTDWDTPLAEIGRFVIYGNDAEDRNFRAGTSFGGGSEDLGRQLLGGQIGEDGTPEAPLVVVKPGENETVTERRPLIEVDLSRLEDIDPDSVVMRIPGVGQVPATFNPDTGKLIYRPVQVIRSPDVSVHVRLRRRAFDKDDVVSWKFFIDQKAHYLPKEPVEPVGRTGG